MTDPELETHLDDVAASERGDEDPTERQTAWERVEDVDPEVVLFGFLSAYVLITLLMFLPFVVFGGYTFAVALPPLLPTVAAFVTGVVGAALLSIRRVAWQVEPADEGTNPPEVDSTAVFLLSMFRVPTVLVGRLVLVGFLLSLYVVLDNSGIAPVTAFVFAEGLIGLVLGSLFGIEVAVVVFVSDCGEIPVGLGGRFWNVESATLLGDLTAPPTPDDADP